MIRRLVPVFVGCVLLSGCGGGGSTVTPVPVSATSATGSVKQNVTVSIAIPGQASKASASTRRPQYISTNTQSASIAVNGGTPVVANLAAGSPNCTPASGTGRTCTVTVSAPAGVDTFTEVTYASTTGTGAPLSQTTTTAKIVAGQANTVNLVLGGVVASIVLTLANATPVEGTPATIPLTVTVLDASNAAIIGSDPFANPITLSDSDASGATKLSDATLTSPVDAAAVTVAYNGAAIPPAVFTAAATGVASSSVTVTPATLTPATASAFVDWPTYGYDAQRTGFNPSTAGITPASIANIRVAWQAQRTGAAQGQPIIITNSNIPNHPTILVFEEFANAQAYDAFTGTLLWQRALPTQDVQDCGLGGISGTAQYDKALNALFMVAGNGAGAPNHVVLYKLDVATGTVLNSVDVTPALEPHEANYSHAGVNLVNGLVYVGTGSDCEGTATGAYPSWRGRVASVNAASMVLAKTFLTTWQQGTAPGNYGGGGVWPWGGVSADPAGNIYVATGNAETNASVQPQSIAAPFAATDNEQSGYAEQLVKLVPDLSSVLASNYPGFNFAVGNGDLDYAGTPVVFQPPLSSGCGLQTATQGKGGVLVVNNAADLSNPREFKLSVPSSSAYYVGNPAYSPNTNFLYAAISSSGNGSSMLPPGLAAIGNCGSSIVWNATFGPDSASFSGENPRSAPIVTAGGVVFIGTPCVVSGKTCTSGATPGGALWAVDATTGAVLNGGAPILTTASNIRMAPSADGLWLFVVDTSGNISALTVDTSVTGVASKPGGRLPQLFSRHHE